MQRRFRPRRRVCAFCADKNKKIDYKDINTLKKYVSDRGKILPRRVTGLNAKHQEKLLEQSRELDKYDF